MRELMMQYKQKIRKELPKIYSQELINNLFYHPYTKIEFLIRDLGITRHTASDYLNKLTKEGLLERIKIGRSFYFLNPPLFNLFSNIPELKKR